MDIMFLQGAGGTGKTSVIKGMQDLKPEGLTIHTLSSSTRASYAKLGISSETASLEMDDETRVKLQLQVMADWAADIETAAQQLWGTKDLLIVDRGPFDRMAYWLLTMMECNPGKVENFTVRMSQMMDWVDSLKADNVLYVEFPYPVSWSTQDNFRTSNELQTMALSLMISSLCDRYHESTKTDPFYWRMDELAVMGATSLERASALMDRYKIVF